MKRIYLFFTLLIFIYGYPVTFEEKSVNAETADNTREIYQDVSPELRLKIDEWMELIYSDDPTVRSSAIISLLGINQPAVYGQLIEVLRNSNNDDVRISLMKVFGFTGDDKALDCMIELLDSEKEAVCTVAADTLGSFRTDKALEKMINVLLDDQGPIKSRILVAGALAKTRSREAVEPLIILLGSDNTDLRIATRSALSEITKQSDTNTKEFWKQWWEMNKVKTREQWLEDIIDELEEDINKFETQNNALKYEIAQKSIKLLETRKEKDDIQPLLDAIKSEYPEIRVFAAKELAIHKGPDITKIFIDLASDSNSELRVLAAKILGEIGDESGIDTLKIALQDDDVKVRESAARAFGKLGSKDAVDDLLHALNDEEYSVISVAAEALGELKANEAVEPLINLLSSEDPMVRESAIVALGGIEDNRAIDSLVDILSDKEERVRWYAADSLGKLGVKKAVGPLVSLLSDESARVRESAVAALGQIGDESSVEHLIKLLQDKDVRVTEKAADVLLSIDCKKFETSDSIANAFYAKDDKKRAIEILNKQISAFEGLPEYSRTLWQNKLRLAKLYYSLDNWQNAVPLYEELVHHFENEIEIKHELIHCLKETKQVDKLLNFYSLWVTNLLTDNRIWWNGIYEILEEHLERQEFDTVRKLIDGFEKDNPYMGGPELKTRFYDLKKRSMKTSLSLDNKPSNVLKE